MNNVYVAFIILTCKTVQQAKPADLSIEFILKSKVVTLYIFI